MGKRKDVPILALSIIQKITDKVLAQGGTEIDIHCLTTPDGEKLLDQLAEMIIELSSSKTKNSPKKVKAQFKNHDEALDYSKFANWFHQDNLDQYLGSGNLESEMYGQELFFQKFYGSDFSINCTDIFVKKSRLPAIKKGLEIGAVNRIIVKPIPAVLTSVQARYNPNQFFGNEILRKSGMEIWKNTSRSRWTSLILDECLAGCIDVVPECFNAVNLRSNWEAECLQVADRKGQMPAVIPNSVEMSFVDGRRNIPVDQKYINQTGKVVKIDDCNFITAIEANIKLTPPAEEIILACQLFDETGEYMATDTYEFNSALLEHSKIKPSVSVVFASSYDSGFRFNSNYADDSDCSNRFRISL